MLERKELRSRQRKTFERMISVVPKLYEVVIESVQCLYKALVNVKYLTITNGFLKKFRFLLKICENISSNVSIEKNKWDEVEKLIAQLCDSVDDINQMIADLKL